MIDFKKWIDLEQYYRQLDAIEANHALPWWRVGILLRRPWRREPIFGIPKSFKYLWGWLTLVHDCQDPAIMCSCSGGFRFPLHKD